MKGSLRLRNAVAVGNGAQLSKYGELWFAKNGIIGENDFVGEKMMMPVFVQMGTKFELVTVLPNRVQVEAKDPTSGRADTSGLLSKFLKAAAEIDVTFIGFNYQWHFHSDQASECGDFINRLVGQPGAGLKSLGWGKGTAAFEVFSELLGGRRRVRIDPSIGDNVSIASETVILDFNYHFGMNDPAQKSSVTHALNMESNAFKDAQEIARQVEAI